MLVREELARDAPIKGGSNQKNNYPNKDKKNSGSRGKEVHSLNCYTEYALAAATYTQALEQSLAIGNIDIPWVKSYIKATSI